MTIVHKHGDINNNTDRLIRWPLPNNIKNDAYLPEEEFTQIPIEGNGATYLKTTSIEEARSSYTQEKNFRILFQFNSQDSKDNSLIHSLEEILRTPSDEGIFNLLDGIIYHRTTHTCVLKIVDRSLINLVMKEFHYRAFSRNIPEDRTRKY
ncbi:hypothetical protein O181_008367 [Austropuccinia psidii MF-1]|uniref:Uncharacterized protein n=1 Tax=Austropuccinia psidii MF-1 TaxID=1389203 RepID=A0A9Q3BNN2_9BASI|nr:hypothetical protein [Austropuccinia psidii MF-1]